MRYHFVGIGIPSYVGGGCSMAIVKSSLTLKAFFFLIFSSLFSIICQYYGT